MKDNRKTIQVLVILTIIFTVMGGSLAYWNWNTTEAQKTNIVFTSTGAFSCAADGGGNITPEGVQIVPTTCTDSEYVEANPGALPRVIKRKVTVTPTVSGDMKLYMKLWLNIDRLDSGLANSDNFRYVLTTSENSCSEGTIKAQGNFKGLTQGDTVTILNNQVYDQSISEEYYLYIWLDREESSQSTMNQSFSFSLGGECTDTSQPEKPVLDANGMIPVTIDENGDVFTVSSDDASWYNYENKEWANAVLVSNPNRQTYLNNLSNNVQVAEEDILAYYVWIPRYRYKIPYKKCSGIPESERNIEDYPECYAPYTMSESDKDKLVNYFVAGDETRMSSGLAAINYALQSGKFFEKLYVKDQTVITKSIIPLVESYNGGYAYYSGFNEAIPDGTQLTLLSSSFNGDNMLKIGEESMVSIDIEFESVNDTMSRGDAINTYYTHPAFTWDGENIAGIWVGKFEPNPDKNDACYAKPSDTNCNDTTQNPTILPNQSSLIGQYIGNQFATSQNLTKVNNIYGLSNVTTDGHMMKSSDWGALAYFSQSKYGINSEIANNEYSTTKSSVRYYKTGCGFSGTSSKCANAYGTDGLTAYPQSTTGNITGVFDVVGGAYEYVMGNYNNTTNAYFSTLPDSKYYDVYLQEQFNGDYIGNIYLCTLETCGGHALSETSGWYDGLGLISMVDSNYNPWVLKSTDVLWQTAGYSGTNSVSDSFGSTILSLSWRSVLVVME